MAFKVLPPFDLNKMNTSVFERDMGDDPVYARTPKNGVIIINENFITFNPLNCKENYEYVMEKLTLIKANVYEEYKKLYSFIQSNQEDDKKILSGTDALVVLKSNSENILAFIVRNKTSVINQNEYYVLIIRFLIILLLLNVIYYLYNKISLKFY